MSNGTGADDFITELRGSHDKSFFTVLNSASPSTSLS